MPDQGSHWFRAAAAADVAEDEPLAIEAGGLKIALFKVDNEYYATGNVCTHAFALLTDGFQEGCEIECPLHNARFDIRTGEARSSPAETPVPTYPVRIAGEALEILLPRACPALKDAPDTL